MIGVVIFGEFMANLYNVFICIEYMLYGFFDFFSIDNLGILFYSFRQCISSKSKALKLYFSLFCSENLFK